MGMKFLNKKGWHTGSLRNIENVWKAEQKHEVEQKKLEELRKQIQEEREKSEFRQLQEQAGLVPRQERLEFLYESGLAVGKGSNANSDGFKAALESSSSSLPPSTNNASAAPSSAAAKQQQPGALFEEKPQSANDAWRKLHSDPLLLIRQREQESLARVKNNPVQMAMIRNSVEATKSKEKSHSKDRKEKKHHKKKDKHHKHSSSVGDEERTDVKRSSKGAELSDKLEYHAAGREQRNKYHKDNSPPETHHRHHRDSSVKNSRSDERADRTTDYDKERRYEKKDVERRKYHEEDKKLESQKRREEEDEERRSHYRHPRHHVPPRPPPRGSTSKLSAEERAAKLKEMQMDAELHEENRWKRIKKADELDTINNSKTEASGSKNFLEEAKRSVYGAEKGGSSTIEESVRRRAHYSQSKSEVGQGNAFRR